MLRRADRWAFSESTRIQLSWLLSASLLLLAVLLPTHAGAAPRDEDSRKVPTRIHDRAQAEGDVRVLVELALPSGRRAEGALSNQARSAYRQEIADTASRVVSRLATHPHRVLRRYLTAPLIALGVGPTALRELEASGMPVKRVMEDRIHKPLLLDTVYLVGADQAWLSTTGFLDKIDERLQEAMADRAAA